MADGKYKRAREIQLGEWLPAGRVIGRIRMRVRDYVPLPSGEEVGAGTLVWDTKTSQWLRAGDLYKTTELRGGYQLYEGFVVHPGSKLCTRGGYYLRDYMEIGADSMEEEYSAALTAMTAPISAHCMGHNIAVA